MTTKNIKIIKVYEYLIPSNAVGIKKIEVSAMLKGRANIVLNLVGLYDQTSYLIMKHIEVDRNIK
jgi:hypothetical protein